MLWQERISQEGIPDEEISESMNNINPLYVPRNHNVEAALQAATKQNNMEPFKKLFSILQNPHKENDDLREYSTPLSGDDSSYKTFCGT